MPETCLDGRRSLMTRHDACNSFATEVLMFKRLLIALGLRSAPAPIRSYLAASSFVGALPALAYVGWKYRAKLLPALKSVQSRALPKSTADERIAIQPGY